MKSLHQTKCLISSLFLLSSFSFQTFAAMDKDAVINTNTEKWHYLIAPYGWFSPTSATIQVDNISKHIFVPLDKVLKSLDFSGEVHLEANKGAWTFMLDPTYIKLSSKVSAGPIFVGPYNQTIIGPIDIHIVSQTLLIDGGIFYKVYQNQWNNLQPFSFEVLGGFRYLGLKNQLTLSPSRTDIFPGIQVSSTSNAIAPIIGGRFKQSYSKGLVWLRTDVGGFSIDKVTNTWSAATGVTYNVSSSTDLALAYRVLKIKVAESSNSSFDTLIYGPELGIVFRF
jgi:hypothetical protein